MDIYLLEELPDLSPLIVDPIRHIAIVVYSLIAIGALIGVTITVLYLYMWRNKMGILQEVTHDKDFYRLKKEREKIQAKIDKIQDIMASGGNIKQCEKQLDKYIEKLHEIDAEICERVI